MLPFADLESARRWSELGARIGRRTSHGSAHDPDPRAWGNAGAQDALAVVDALGAPDGTLGVVADWGCGAGRLEPFLAQWSDWVFAADACEELVRPLEDTDPNIGVVVTDIPELAAPHGQCDLVVSLHVLYSVTPDGVRETIRQLGQLLKVGGKLVLDIPWWHEAEPYHRDPDPEGLPGGWWIHSGITLMNGTNHMWLTKAPDPLRYGAGAAPRWSDLAELRLWVWEKQL